MAAFARTGSRARGTRRAPADGPGAPDRRGARARVPRAV